MARAFDTQTTTVVHEGRRGNVEDASAALLDIVEKGAWTRINEAKVFAVVMHSKVGGEAGFQPHVVCWEWYFQGEC